MRVASLAAIVLVVLCGGADAAQPICIGTGCPYIKIETIDGCVDLSNIGTDPIAVHPSAANVGADTIAGRSHARPQTADGQCVGNYDFAYSAFVQAAASTEGCAKVRNIAELGWQGEHKQKFCKTKGFTASTNFQNAGSREYGGGFCYTGNPVTCLKLMEGYPR
ncbi:MAG TPA: hypothetical protein VMJ74_17345 [Pseudomonadales bacterium]|nr:hypothetical protein [Pseudomonadales bacterium]